MRGIGSPFSLFRSHRRDRRGQTMAEYVIVAGVIAIGAITTVILFGNLLLGVFSKLAARINDQDIEDNYLTETATKVLEDSILFKGMENFEREGYAWNPPGIVPPPPVADDPFAYSATHHIGDNWAVGTIGGGTAYINEGLSYTFNITITAEMIAYAKSQGGTLYLCFDAGGYGQAFINNETVDHVMIDGNSIGTAKNGHNVLAFDVAGMTPGSHSLTFTSGILWGSEHDDWDFWNLKVTYAPQ